MESSDADFVVALGAFITQRQHDLENLLKEIKWTDLNVDNEKDKELLQCPHDSNHWIPPASFQKHVKKCLLKKKGIDVTHYKELPSSKEHFYRDASAVVSLNPVLQQPKYIQQTEPPLELGPSYNFDVSHLNTEVIKPKDKMSTAEKLEQYLHDVAVAKQHREKNGITLVDLSTDAVATPTVHKGEQTKPKSQLEILAEQRDYKRRRARYRARNVHITKKTPTQIARDMIAQRMDDIYLQLGIPIPGADTSSAEKEEEEEELQPQHGRGDRDRGRGDRGNWSGRGSYQQKQDFKSRGNYQQQQYGQQQYQQRQQHQQQQYGQQQYRNYQQDAQMQYPQNQQFGQKQNYGGGYPQQSNFQHPQEFQPHQQAYQQSYTLHPYPSQGYPQQPFTPQHQAFSQQPQDFQFQQGFPPHPHYPQQQQPQQQQQQQMGQESMRQKRPYGT